MGIRPDPRPDAGRQLLEFEFENTRRCRECEVRPKYSDGYCEQFFHYFSANRFNRWIMGHCEIALGPGFFEHFRDGIKKPGFRPILEQR